jgi:YVTN family beta-propeller protein
MTARHHAGRFSRWNRAWLAGAFGPAVLASQSATAQDYVFATHTSNAAPFVSVINRSTNAVQIVQVGARNNGIAAAPDGSKVYVVASGLGVQVIDTRTLTVIDTIPMSDLVFDMRVSPDGTRGYVTRGSPPTLFVLDLTSNTVIAALPTISNAVYLDMTPDGSRLYISTSRISPVETMVSVFDTATSTFIDFIDIGRYPAEMKVSPNDQFVYISNELNASVTVLDRATHAIVTTIPVGVQPRGIAFSADGSRGYVTNAGAGTVSVIDTATHTVIGTIQMGGGFPIAMEFVDGNTAWVSRWSANAISIVDTTTNAVSGTVLLSAGPFMLLSITVPPECYANCDHSTTPPVLNVEDFTCFISEFAAASTLPPAQQVTHYANCDGSTTEPVLNVEDFTCFISAFASGCP